MEASKGSEGIDFRRRRLFGAAAGAIVAAQLRVVGPANAQAETAGTIKLPTIKPETNASFSSLKQIEAGVLNVGYA